MVTVGDVTLGEEPAAVSRLVEGWPKDTRPKAPEASTGCDHAALSSAVLRAFEAGRGDFRIRVVQDDDDDLSDKDASGGREFHVISAILAEWSDVFGAMLKHEMAERREGGMEIRGFSPGSVAAFLRFLHSGRLEATPSIIVEVAALADKYVIPALQDLCASQAEAMLTPANACDIFKSASRVGSSAGRTRALEVIHQNAKEALKAAHSLPPALLEEVLSSPLLCISDYALAEVFMEWAERGLHKRHGHNIGNLMMAHVQFAALTEEEFSRVQVVGKRAGIGEAIEKLRRRSKRGTHTWNAFGTLWEEYVSQFQKSEASFLGFWLNIIPSRADFGHSRCVTHSDQHAQLSYYARGELSVPLYKHDEVTWFMPHHSVYITGLFLLGSLDEGASVQVSASMDGLNWEYPYGQGLHGPREQFVLTPCRLKVSAKWIRLTVLEGQYPDGRIHVHGILQAA